MAAQRREKLIERVQRLEFDGHGARIPLRIAEVRLDLITRSDPVARFVENYFSDYVTGSDPAEAELEVEHWPESSLWEDPDPEFEIRGDAVIQRDFAARKLSSARAVALAGVEIEDAVHNLLRWFVPSLLLRRSAFLLHGAGVVKDGKGYVFFGQSGAGKSTSVSLVSSTDPRALVIGDDAVIVQMRGQMRGEGPVLYAAPLGCGYSHSAPPPVSVPLAGLYALEQSDGHAVEYLPPSRGAASLLASAMCVRFEDAVEERMDLALRFASSRCGVRRLHFRRDGGFWNEVRADH